MLDQCYFSFVCLLSRITSIDPSVLCNGVATYGAVGHVPLDFKQFNFFSVNFRAAQSLTSTLRGCLSKHICILRQQLR